MQRHSRKKRWIVVVSIAVLLHVALFYSVRPSFFSAFRKTIDADSGDGRGQPAPPRFIITIPVEIDDSPSPDMEQNPVQQPTPKVVAEHQATENAVTKELREGYETETPADIENLVGESPQTMPDNIGPEAVVIPPRPLEITWPDTRRLKHCLGHHVDVHIEVSAEGHILQVKADDPGQPPDCIEAALRSARLIVFEPGHKDGHPATMWTRVRIEFRKKN
ncbi:MAG: energy transducer TonB [Candidatus Krumholzibacteriia bacterium]